MRLDVFPIDGIPEVRRGDDLAGFIAAAEPGLQAGDVVVVTQKVVSKAEGAMAQIDPADPRGHKAIVESQSVRVVRRRGDLIISETRHGFVCANAGIDQSNASAEGELVLLPEDPDASARRLREGIGAARGVRPAVVVADSFGRAWRMGQTDVAIGLAGLSAIDEWRGRPDAFGRELRVTSIAVADAAAGAADLARAKDSRQPAVLVRGLERYVSAEDGPGAAVLRRPAEQDLFR
jgi:coenzyme F420-0:L-glutamate ligase/coenzyme F420-1:gamma-L-glutamate ligase